MQFEFIQPERVRGLWPAIRERIERVCRKSPAGWIPEDVYHALQTSAAQLFIVWQDGALRAFCVLKFERDEFSGQPYLWIWAAESMDGHSEAVEFGMENICELARKSGLPSVRFASRRKGWAKRYPIKTIIYEVDPWAAEAKP
jgi:hypothetical protein